MIRATSRRRTLLGAVAATALAAGLATEAAADTIKVAGIYTQPIQQKHFRKRS